jgi:hypothetical protein
MFSGASPRIEQNLARKSIELPVNVKTIAQHPQRHRAVVHRLKFDVKQFSGFTFAEHVHSAFLNLRQTRY